MKFSYRDSALVPESEIQKTLTDLSLRTKELKESAETLQYKQSEDFIHLPLESADLKLAKKIAEEKGKDLKWVFVVGIGGANLGAQAVAMALRYSAPEGNAKLLFFDTVDPYFLEHFRGNVKNLKNKEEFVVLVISKSGETLEPLANAKQVVSILEEKFPEIEDRVIVLSTEDSPLWKSVGEGVQKVALRSSISDRYSVFSIEGILPLALGGVDVDAFLGGGREIITACFGDESENNPAALSASLLSFHMTRGTSIRDFFFFVPELEYVGKWSRQLVAESLGKDGKGVAPTVSIGTTDLHSMAQLYLAGPKNRFTTFVYIETLPEMKIGASKVFHKLEPALETRGTHAIIGSIYDGYKESCKNAALPFSEILLPGLSERSLGMFMQFLMIETVLLADLLKVNAFDQGAVEEYKKRAREILNS